jgi:cytochrome c
MSLELNKAFAGILTAGIAFMVTGIVAGNLVHPHMPAKSAIQIGDVAPAGGGAPAPAAAPAAALEPIGPLLANANPANGERLAKAQCAACHSFNEGGRAGVGPNLHAVVGRAHAAAEGFAYSASLKSHEGPWTYDQLNAWLAKPATYAPGTKMAFAGISNTQQRADIIAYLRSISPSAPNP